MQSIAASQLIVGEPVFADLYDSDGELFLRAGQIVRAIDLTINRARIESGIYTKSPGPAFIPTPALPDDEDNPTVGEVAVEATGQHKVTVSNLRVGEALRGDIIDANGVLLLSAGSVITERFIERLKARGIQEVTERFKDAPVQDSGAASDPATSSLDAKPKTSATKEERKKSRPDASKHVSGIKNNFAPLSELSGYIKGGRHAFKQAVSDVKVIVDDLVNGRLTSGDGLRNIVNALATSIGADAGLAMLLMQFKSEAPDYLYEHCVQTSMVAMRVAAQLDHTDSDVMDIGMAALVQDIGMLRVPDDIRFADRVLNREERSLVQQHPDHAVSMLADITKLPACIPTIVFQTHERADGSGYPRRRSGMFIHPLARILGAVDTFVALTQDRPYRPARHPHHAMMHVLGQAKQGRFDKVVIRGMLESISLYPVGCYVQLSTEKTAQVIRCNATQYARPVVVHVKPDGSLADRELDLIKRPRTQIVGPVPCPTSARAA